MAQEKYSKYGKSLKGRYRTLKRDSKKRGFKNSLNFKDYSNLMKLSQCFYCGTNNLGSRGYGLDRINNSKGYYLNNVVVCCKSCNRIKGEELTFEEAIFIIHSLKLYRKT